MMFRQTVAVTHSFTERTVSVNLYHLSAPLHNHSNPFRKYLPGAPNTSNDTFFTAQGMHSARANGGA